MESSTPHVSTDLRRKTLLRSVVLSPLRKSIDTSHNASFLDTSNDDEERANRRQQVELQKRLSNISQNRINYNDSFVQEQYVMCTHLYTENKITMKNAWKLQIINMLKPLCQKSGNDTLQVAGTSMDICAKVYGLRVDDAHADGLKLATNLARTAASNQKAQDNEDDDEDPEDGQSKDKNKAKRKKNRRVNLEGNKNTVSQNPENFCGQLPKLEPTDFTTRVKAETGTIENLLTYVLKENSIGCTFVLFDKGEKLFDDRDKLIENANKDEGISLDHLPQLQAGNLQINIPCNHFRIDKDYDPSQENQNMDGDKSQTLGQLAVDEQGFPIYELDGSVHENFDNMEVDQDNGNEDFIQSMHVEIAPQIRGELERIVDFRPQDNQAETSEYSYNSIVNTRAGKYIDQIWAGPSHWKLKFIRRSGPRFTGEKILQKVGNIKRKTEPDLIDFDEDVGIDAAKKVTKRKPPTTDVNKITLPPISLTVIKALATLKELMLRPNVCPVEKKPEQNKELDYEVSNYNYDNPNDSNYCVQNNDNEANDEGFEDNNDDIFASPECYNENLVDAPEMVPTNYVPYALKAKQMDMKKLKAAVWQILTHPTEKTVPQQKNIYPTTFSNMYKQLPSLLPKKEKEELSCPLAFVALLHLCNEQNLFLVQHHDYKDFDVNAS